MNVFEKEALLYLLTHVFNGQRKLAAELGLSLGLVNRSLQSLRSEGFLDEDNCPTQKAEQLLSENRPRNAVILAAGFGMRMIPVSNIPKAMLEVKGERLIDRLIRQLHEAGVSDISVIVGFQKEWFEYLIDRYHVRLVFNGEYAKKNNLTSMNLAADQLGNTYVVPCDIWCRVNPFRRQELYSWYMLSDRPIAGAEVRVNRKREIVRVPAQAEGNAMIGISYLTQEDAEPVRERIKRYADLAAYDQAFWETALYNGEKMCVSARVADQRDVVEVNTYEQLRELDAGSEQLRSDALGVIASVLHCSETEIGQIQVLKKGMTNNSFQFSVRDKKYIMRIPGQGTELLINRRQEADTFRAIRGRGLCDDPIYINPDDGYKITRFLENVRVCDVQREEDLIRCMEKLRDFHRMKIQVPHSFDIFEQINYYESLWNGQPSVFPDYRKTKEAVFSLRSFIDSQEKDRCLTHIDAVCDNFLFYIEDGEEKLQLTDWEYSGMQDPLVDIAMFCIYSYFDKEKTNHLIDLYFDNHCDDFVRARIYCYMAACGLLWSNWSEYKRQLGVEFGEYLIRQYRYAKEYAKHAGEIIHRTVKEDAEHG